MFEERNPKRTFYSAPQSIHSMIAALLEPSITVAALVAAYAWVGATIDRPELTLGLIVYALTFPGRNRFRDRPWGAAIDIVLSWLMFLAILALFGYATRSIELFNWEALKLWMVLTPCLQCLAAWLGGRLVRHRLNLPQARKRAVVVGAGPLGVKVARALVARKDEGIDFVGYFDDRTDARTDEETAPFRLGRFKELSQYISEHGIHEVYVTLPLGSQPRILQLMGALQGTTASLYFVPDVFGISIIQGRLHDMNGVPVVGLCETPFTGTNALAKRLSDIVLSSLILVLASPLLAAVALGVKLSSPGPVIFRQRRNGLAGEEIIVYKFRSMRVQEDGAVVPQASRDDPRVTPFGAFIRRTSLDELPQFFNVLQGRMSIVGPRPHAVAHNETYRNLIRAYMVRHKVRPGITGWAQVNGHRGETDTVDKMQARVEYDLEYLRNWSLGLDLQIILRTIGLVFADRHAY